MNYDAIPGLINQLCAQHILRDLAAEALQGQIHAANTARAQGLPAIPGDIAAPLIHAFKHGCQYRVSSRLIAASRSRAVGRAPSRGPEHWSGADPIRHLLVTDTTLP